MNRAILIVICDFIVSAMLSLFTGSAVGSAEGTRGAALDDHTAMMVVKELRREQAELEKQRKALLDAQYRLGFTGDRQRQLEELSERLAEATAKADLLARKAALTREEAGALTPEALQKQLEREIKNRYRLHLSKEEVERQLAHLRKQNAETAQSYSNLTRTYRELRDEHASKKGQLELLKQQQAIQQKQLLEAGTALSRSREVIAARTAELQKSRGEIRKLEMEGNVQLEKRRAAESALAFARGKLNATEQELVEAQSRSDRSARQLASRDLELKEARRQLENLQKMLKTAVTDLSATRADLTKTKETSIRNARALAQASGELAAARDMLTAAEAKLRSDVQKKYSGAVIRVDMQMEETRMLIPVKRQGSFYLPVILAGGRTCVVGELPNLTGNVRNRPDYAAVTSLKYQVSPAEKSGSGKAWPGPLYVFRQEPSIVLMEVKLEGRTPLKALTMTELKQRGLQDLYLFKNSSLGRDSAALGGRCSLEKQYFYIRNAVHGSGSELRAEPGDFVLTKQGEFVALVVGIVNSDMGRRQEACCVMMPENFDWKDTAALPVSGADALKKFNQAAVPLLREIRMRSFQTDRR